MADITITITADEDDLRSFAQSCQGNDKVFPSTGVANAIAAALPAPRIPVKPGMVLRHRRLGHRAFIREGQQDWHVSLIEQIRHGWGGLIIDKRGRGLDPDEWEVLLDAEDGAS